MIYPSQICAARGLTGISQTELATRAGLSLATIKRVEASGDDLRVNLQTVIRIQKALEAVGVIFIDQDEKHGPGVRLKSATRDVGTISEAPPLVEASSMLRED